ncbi:HCP-like protein [Linnemannia elongata AG-77]|uniref:HCP-like protein n=1 Tax=Linnemannia elongata AG-77 TaxID=1314771 RepID=A0A197JMW0_9FUNG|nr:HCP-like protein [Linnemannia elongata AG-77]
MHQDSSSSHSPVQAIRSVARTHPPTTSTTPTNSDHVFYIECHKDPVTNKDVVLWNDILQAFEDALHVRHQAMIVPFVKGSDLRTLEPRRFLAVPDTVLEVVVGGQLATTEVPVPMGIPHEPPPSFLQDEPMQEPPVALLQGAGAQDAGETASLNATRIASITTRRDPVYGFEKIAMANDSHVENPATRTYRAPHAILGEQTQWRSSESQKQPFSSENQRRAPQDITTPAAKTLVQIIVDAINGDTMDQVALGDMYRTGQGVQQDYQTAMDWYRKAADQGDSVGLRKVGVLHEHGQGVTQSYTTALEWYLRAAECGHPAAQLNIGILYRHGYGVPQDYDEAMAWFVKAADQGYAAAQNNIGLLYRHGQGVPQDYSQALAWFHKATDQGYAPAEVNVGISYRLGEGVPQNDSLAMAWLLKGAEKGDKRGQYYVGMQYLYGEGTIRDVGQALEWLLRAAKQGHIEAQYNVGNMYRLGQGEGQDLFVAMGWYEKAAAQGHVEAKRYFDRLRQVGRRK